MTELSREQVESVRVLAQHYDGTPVELFGVSVRALCDMALRTHDAEADRDNYRAKFREAKQALRDVRPEIDSLAAGLYRTHVNPSDGIVHDEDVAHEIAQLTELHERVVQLLGERGAGMTDGRQYQAINRAALTECEARLDARDREIDKLRTRAQRAEAECERLRGIIHDVIEELPHVRAKVEGAQLASRVHRAVVATPPPEGEPSHVPPIVNNTPDGKPDEIPDTPEQAHGDALADDDLDGALDCLYTKAMHGRDLNGPDAYAISQAYDLVRRHLTASGVPGHWACKNRGRADQYRAEAMACRRALGFDAESHDVSPTDLTSAIADSGVPYIPEEVRRLPERMRSAAREMQAQEPKPGSRLSGRIDEAWVWADELEAALASAPAARDWLTLLEREDLGLVPISVPTGGDDFDVQWTVVSYHMAEPKERVIGRGPTPRDALSDAAPF